MRKTIEIKRLRDAVNRMNKLSTCSKQERRGWNSLLEVSLHETGNCNGFSYLTEDEVPDDCEPGVIMDESGELNHEFPDDSRRHYF